MSRHNDWSQRRRASHQAQTSSDSALALCVRHLQTGALTNAARAALLAQRLLRLETERTEHRRKQELKAAADCRRAEAALEEARKAVDTLNAQPAGRAKADVLCSDEDWPETLKRMLADANAQRLGSNAQISSQPVQTAAPDSC